MRHFLPGDVRRCLGWPLLDPVNDQVHAKVYTIQVYSSQFTQHSYVPPQPLSPELLRFPTSEHTVLVTNYASTSWLEQSRHKLLSTVLEHAFASANLQFPTIGSQANQLDPTHAIILGQAILDHAIPKAWNNYWPLELRRWRRALFLMRARNMNGGREPCDSHNRLPPTSTLASHLRLLTYCKPTSPVPFAANAAYNEWSRLNTLNLYVIQFLNMAVPSWRQVQKASHLLRLLHLDLPIPTTPYGFANARSDFLPEGVMFDFYYSAHFHNHIGGPDDSNHMLAHTNLNVLAPSSQDRYWRKKLPKAALAPLPIPLSYSKKLFQYLHSPLPCTYALGHL